MGAACCAGAADRGSEGVVTLASVVIVAGAFFLLMLAFAVWGIMR